MNYLNNQLLVSQDAWQSFDTFQMEDDKHHRPVVPEARTYGAIFILICFGAMIYIKWRRKILN